MLLIIKNLPLFRFNPSSRNVSLNGTSEGADGEIKNDESVDT